MGSVVEHPIQVVFLKYNIHLKNKQTTTVYPVNEIMLQNIVGTESVVATL